MNQQCSRRTEDAPYSCSGVAHEDVEWTFQSQVFVNSSFRRCIAAEGGVAVGGGAGGRLEPGSALRPSRADRRWTSNKATSHHVIGGQPETGGLFLRQGVNRSEGFLKQKKH